MMEFRQLRTFRAVADHLSFTRAAKRLNMAQSSVSAQIRALEEELTVKLFDRIGRRVLLTDAGTKLYAYAKRVEGMTEEIRSEVTGETYTRGSLTIRVPETLAAVYMPAVVERFHAQHPDVRLKFINCSDRQLREELNSGSIDLAFLIVDAIHFKQVNVRMLRTEPMVLVAAASHPLAAKKRVRPMDLKGQTFLLPTTDCSYRKSFERSLARAHVAVKILDFSSVLSMRFCLERGVGLTVCPEVAVMEELANGTLKRLNWEMPDPDPPVLMIWHAEKWCSPLLRQFMVFSEEVMLEGS